MRIRIFSGLILALAFSLNANALSVSLVGPDIVLPGEQFDIQIIGDFEDQGFLAGGIQVLYDANLATVDNFEFALGVDPDLSCPGAGLCPVDEPGTLSIVWGQMARAGVLAIAPGRRSYDASLKARSHSRRPPQLWEPLQPRSAFLRPCGPEWARRPAATKLASAAEIASSLRSSQ